MATGFFTKSGSLQLCAMSTPSIDVIVLPKTTPSTQTIGIILKINLDLNLLAISESLTRLFIMPSIIQLDNGSAGVCLPIIKIILIFESSFDLGCYPNLHSLSLQSSIVMIGTYSPPGH